MMSLFAATTHLAPCRLIDKLPLICMIMILLPMMIICVGAATTWIIVAHRLISDPISILIPIPIPFASNSNSVAIRVYPK